jgi:hypothetical protein
MAAPNHPSPWLIPDAREAKLAQWARDTLAHLRSEVEMLEKALAALRGENEGSNVVIAANAGMHGRPELPLPKNSRIDFATGWGKIQVHHDLKGNVRVQGDSSLVVYLEAGNALTVKLKD